MKLDRRIFLATIGVGSLKVMSSEDPTACRVAAHSASGFGLAPPVYKDVGACRGIG